MSTTVPRPTARSKDVCFPLSIEWVGGRRVHACVEGKPAVAVAPPPVFRGTDPELWSPEDLFVAAAASCLAVTFTGLAERAGVRLASLRVDADGTVGGRADEHYGFTAIQLKVRVVVAPTDTDLAYALALQAEERCLVSASMALPVTVSVDVRTSGE